ncbi:MAG: hypothetical protein ABI726_06860 [bacterium]
MSARAPEADLAAARRSSLRRDWLLVYLGLACCVAIAVAVVLVAVRVL